MADEKSNALVDFLTSPTVRRILVALSTGAVVALNKRLGLELDATEVGSLVTLAVAYLAQSVVMDRARILAQAEADGAAAAAAVQTVEDAKKALGITEVKP